VPLRPGERGSRPGHRHQEDVADDRIALRLQALVDLAVQGRGRRRGRR
jgi:hypothetical protein